MADDFVVSLELNVVWWLDDDGDGNVVVRWDDSDGVGVGVGCSW